LEDEEEEFYFESQRRIQKAKEQFEKTWMTPYGQRHLVKLLGEKIVAGIRECLLKEYQEILSRLYQETTGYDSYGWPSRGGFTEDAENEIEKVTPRYIKFKEYPVEYKGV
jgi:hypothetical protein